MQQAALATATQQDFTAAIPSAIFSPVNAHLPHLHCASKRWDSAGRRRQWHYRPDTLLQLKHNPKVILRNAANWIESGFP